MADINKFSGYDEYFVARVLEQHPTATLSHYKRISDYLKHGSEVWYRLHHSAIEFLDGDDEADTHELGPEKLHFRLGYAIIYRTFPTSV